MLLSCPLVLKYRLLKLRRLTKDVAFGILSMFLPPGGNGSVCSASKAIEDAGRRIFYFLYGDNQYGMGHARHCGIFEVVWATCMKYSEGFTKLSWSLLTFAGMAVSFFLLARDENTAARYGLCGLDRYWRAWFRDRRHHLVQRAGDSRAAHFCCTAAYRHHRFEDHVGLIHTIILPRPARRCAAADPERTVRCAVRR